MSRPSEPIQSKIDRGTYRASRDGSLEAIPNPEPANDQPPPETLQTEGKRIWNDHYPRLKQARILTVADVPAFEAMCKAFDDVTRCDEQLRSEGDFFKNDKGLPVRHPLAVQRDKYISERNSLLKQFGMMPLARGSMQIPPATMGTGISIRKR